MPGHVDAVLHLASPASPIDFSKIPIQILKVGSLGTHNSLGLARAKGAKFQLNSTSEVYGDPLVHPQTEDYWGNVNPIGPRGVYDEAKRFAEAMTMAYHRAHDLDVRIVRTFNTYGPRMRPDDGRVVTNFVVQALRGEPTDAVRRRQPDPKLLLRRRSDRRPARAARLELRRPGEHRQPRRVHRRPVRPARHRDHGVSLDGRVPAASAGRPDAASARHHAGAHPARLGAQGRRPRRASPAQSTGSARISLADREPGPRPVEHRPRR